MNVVKSTLGVITLGAGLLLLAGPTHAKGNVIVDIPSLSIGYYSSNHGYHHGSNYSNHYGRQGYSKRYRHKDRCDHRSHRKKHKRFDYHRRGYDSYGYRDRGYNSSPYRRGYRQSYNVCPDPGYSRYRIDRHYCYAHKDHFHCE